MNGKAFLVAMLSVTIALAGCSDEKGGDKEDTPITGDPGDLAKGKGAIAGLLLDDRFRPIADGTVLVQQTGDTTTSNEDGEFFFVDLEPGSYRLRADVPGHESLPVNIDVKEGEFAEQRVVARRVVSDDGSIITREYSVFVPCAVSVPASSITLDCTADGSGDTFRSGFDSDLQEYDNITYVVTEMKAASPASPEKGAYKVVVREQGDGQYYGSEFTVDGDYIRIVMKLGAKSEQDTEDRNSNWTNDRALETLLFPQGGFKSESQGALDTMCSTTDPAPPEVPGLARGCWESRGLGAQFGVRAQFVQSVFLGEPEVDIDSYRTFR